jgi:hypothetical protein
MRLSDILIFVVFVLMLMPAVRATIGIGVEPTVVKISLQNSYRLSVYVWDVSDTDDNYTFVVSDNIKDYIQQDCTGSNWCAGKGFYVPAGTARKGNEVFFNFVRYGDDAVFVNGTITVKANPVTGRSGTVVISPQVDIRVELSQLPVTTSTTSVVTSIVTTSVTTTAYNSASTSASTTTVMEMPVVQPPPSTVSPVTPIIDEITHNPPTTTESTTTTVAQHKSSMPDWAWWLITLAVLAAVAAGGYLFLKWYF